MSGTRDSWEIEVAVDDTQHFDDAMGAGVNEAEMGSTSGSNKVSHTIDGLGNDIQHNEMATTYDPNYPDENNQYSGVNEIDLSSEFGGTETDHHSGVFEGTLRRNQPPDNTMDLKNAVENRKWEDVINILTADKEKTQVIVNDNDDSSLMVALKSKADNSKIQGILKITPDDALMLTDLGGNTPLHIAVENDNIDAVEILIQKNRNLLSKENEAQELPMDLACKQSHREMIEYLLSKVKKPGDCVGPESKEFIEFALKAELYDIVLDAVKRYRSLAFKETEQGIDSPVHALALNPSAFPSKMKFNPWRSFLYSCVPDKLLMKGSILENLEDPSNGSNLVYPEDRLTNDSTSANPRNPSTEDDTAVNPTPPFKKFCGKLHEGIWKLLEMVPVFDIKGIRLIKAKHRHAVALMDWLANNIKDSDKEKELLKKILFMGARNGIIEIVEAIIKFHPNAVELKDNRDCTFFHFAVMNRRENIFKIFNSQPEKVKRNLLSNWRDGQNNNSLHLVSRKPSQEFLDFDSHTIFQMQYELKWYQELDSMDPTLKTQLNKDNKSPLMVFIEEHRDIAKKETDWILAMANSSLVAATIITTLAFAAVITVPGGTKSETGLPFFSGRNPFPVFIISDALAVVCAVTTVISFLSVYTSQHGVNDFSSKLPKRVIAGLFFLTFAVISLMVAFGASTMIMVAPRRPLETMLITMLSCIPIIMFGILQIPSLVRMLKSTYGPNMFKRYHVGGVTRDKRRSDATRRAVDPKR